MRTITTAALSDATLRIRPRNRSREIFGLSALPKIRPKNVPGVSTAASSKWRSPNLPSKARNMRIAGVTNNMKLAIVPLTAPGVRCPWKMTNIGPGSAATVEEKAVAAPAA